MSVYRFDVCGSERLFMERKKFMKNKLFALCALACAACGMTACEDGQYQDLKCDSSYVAECLDAKNMMSCVNGTLVVTKCQNNFYCTSQNGAAAQCAPASDNSVSPQPQCDFAGSKCQGTNLLTCTNGILSSQSCLYGCDPATNVCKQQPVPSECDFTGSKCQGDNLLTCSNGVLSTTACEFGCDASANVCKAQELPENCTPGEKKCAGNAGLAVCDDDGKWAYADCICVDDPTDGSKCDSGIEPPADPCAACTDNQVCKNGSCADIPTDIEVSDVVACQADDDCGDGLVCANKACVPAGMLEANDGDACPEDWYKTHYYEACDADGNARYCAYDDDDNVVLFVDKCSTACKMAYVADEDYYTAVCDVPDSAKCFEENEELGYCDDSYDDFAFESYYVCMPSTDGSLTAVDMSVWGEYNECKGTTCSADGLTCADGAMPTSCEFETKCDGSTFYYCYDLGIFGVYDGSEDCSELGMVCDTIDGAAGCFKPCDNAGSVSYACNVDEEEGTLNLVTNTCTSFGEGQVYEITSSRTCGNACDADNGACKALEVGAECDEVTFVPECLGNALTKCEGVVVAIDEDCEASGNVCATFGGEGYCMGACDSEDAERTACQEFGGAGAMLDLVCSKDDNGTLVWDIDGGHYCSSHVCASDSECKKLVDDEGSECDYKTHSDACRGSILVTCNDENVLEAMDCGFEEAECGVLTDGYGEGIDYASCFTAEDACEEEGAQKNVCVDTLFISYLSNLQCYNTSIGLYYIANHNDYCKDYCTDESSCEIMDME